MSLNWYPGHMTQARRELASLMPSQDVVIEVLDSRVPASSSNPVITELRRDKPCIKVLTKSDLSDPAVTKAWVKHFEREPNVSAFASTTTRSKETVSRLFELCARLPVKTGPTRPLRALIAGVPNVGKSTLLNTLMARAVAAVGDKPAVTKVQQRVVLQNGTVLTDSPGLMWPKIEDESGAYRLALAGSIPDTAIDYQDVGLFAARLLLETYPQLVKARFKLEALPATPELLLEEIGRKRGAIRGGGVIDLHKAAEVLVHDFRSGDLGRISLERPRP